VPIDPEQAAYNARVYNEVPRPVVATAQARRARAEAVMQHFPYPPDDVARSEHWLVLPGREIMVRVYRPGSGQLPGVLWLHGGGWVAGSVDTHDGVCAALARDANVVVASVQYRRAPENPWPAPNDDAYAALEWYAANARDLGVDASRIGVGGDSAGAHLAIGAALQARQSTGPRLALMLLAYPVVEPDFETPSYHEHGDGSSLSLSRDDMIEYWQQYLPQGPAAGDLRAVPGRALLGGLPSAHIVVAGNDPLHDEGASFAARLRAAGVPATLAEAPTLTHGFLRAAPYVRAAREAQQRMNAEAGAALRTLGSDT
jgi:acetyl esterase